LIRWDPRCEKIPGIHNSGINLLFSLKKKCTAKKCLKSLLVS
jgi:hypothetical protein